MVRCRGCKQDLITSAWTNRCVFCGKKANALKAGVGTRKWSQRGQQKAVTTTITKQALASSSLTWQQAEHVALDWMVKNGYRDASLTESGADGGIDITARKAVAQVKHHAKPVGLGEMQRIFGIAQATGRKALFFSSAGYTPKAKQWAREHGIALYRFPPVRRDH